MSKIATIIINRNLPKVTDRLYQEIKKNNSTDIYVIDAGSDKDKLSKNCTWYIKDKDTKINGLRYNRGINLALAKLYNSSYFKKYNIFFCITNDTEIITKKFDNKILKIFNKHKKLGILSPLGTNWGEKFYLKKIKTKYFWFIHNHAYFLRKEFIEDLCNNYKPYKINFLFDGSNFRGYGSEIELIAKGYANNWASAITSEMKVQENSTYLISKSQLIKTETYEENFKLYLNEGKKWMKRKYGFNDKWSLNMYSKLFYDNFFEQNPECVKYRL